MFQKARAAFLQTADSRSETWARLGRQDLWAECAFSGIYGLMRVRGIKVRVN